MEKNDLKLKIKASTSIENAVSYLEDIISSLKAGKIVLQKGEECMALSPKENVSFEVKATEKKDKEKLSVEISWRKNDIVVPAEETVFKITSKEPKNVNVTKATAEAETKSETKNKEKVKDKVKKEKPKKK